MNSNNKSIQLNALDRIMMAITFAEAGMPEASQCLEGAARKDRRPEKENRVEPRLTCN